MDLNIIVIGKAGAGNSSLISLLLPNDLKDVEAIDGLLLGIVTFLRNIEDLH